MVETRSRFPPNGAALILIDLQRAIDHPGWGQRNNPNAEANVWQLLARWRKNKWPVFHVRHDSTDPNSHYRPGQIGNEFKPEFMPIEGESIIAKRTNNAFVGTALESELASLANKVVVVVGVITNNSVETTVRMAGNIGFVVYLVADGCFTFDKFDWDGVHRSAQEVHAMSLANLDREYCTVLKTKDLIEAISS